MTILFIFAMFPAMTGCANIKSDKNMPPERWNTKSLTESIYLCGTQLSYPLTVDSLGDDFEIDADSVQSNGTGSKADIKYKGDKVCVFCFSCSEDEISRSQEVGRIVFVPDDSTRDCISINGFTANDSMEKLSEFLGEPSRGKGVYVTYEGDTLVISEGEGGSVFAISIDFGDIDPEE